ncbi:hypothetical protein [Streptomyces sp. NPDC005968]|uniref:hypothetical protein n=1 Tax=unclassified Streptomyces TaxID=2593676 RepID=UPI0033D4648A
MTTYLGSGDESRRNTEYQPEWLSNLADDVTLEASVMSGIARGPQAVKDILGFARTLYDYQEFIEIGEFGANGFAEDYVARVIGEPIGNVVVIRRNEAGQTSGIVISHRPLRSVLLWSRLMYNHFRGTQYEKYFVTPDATVIDALIEANEARQAARR